MEAERGLRVRTGAKLNLFLRVVGRRPDGYHELESIFQALDLADDLAIDPVPNGRITVHMEAEAGPPADFPPERDNLVYLAALRLQEASGIRLGASIRVTKRIPLGGGLGGGSSNAAGALAALNEVWGLGLDRARLLQLASEIGSDVPFCLSGGASSVVTGRGERLARLPAAPAPLWFVLGISNAPLSTAAVYRALPGAVAEGPPVAPVAAAVAAGGAAAVARLLHNDLEPVALRLRPELAGKKDALLEAGALGAALTGSGPTLFAVAAGEASARSIEATVEGVFDRVAVTCSAPRCVRPL